MTQRQWTTKWKINVAIRQKAILQIFEVIKTLSCGCLLPLFVGVWM